MENKDKPIHATISHSEEGDDGRFLNVYDTLGLTKREWFAGMALQGYAAAGSTGMPSPDALAAYAIAAADELIKQLDKS